MRDRNSCSRDPDAELFWIVFFFFIPLQNERLKLQNNQQIAHQCLQTVEPRKKKHRTARYRFVGSDRELLLLVVNLLQRTLQRNGAHRQIERPETIEITRPAGSDMFFGIFYEPVTFLHLFPRESRGSHALGASTYGAFAKGN